MKTLNIFAYLCLIPPIAKREATNSAKLVKIIFFKLIKVKNQNNGALLLPQEHDSAQKRDEKP